RPGSLCQKTHSRRASRVGQDYSRVACLRAGEAGLEAPLPRGTVIGSGRATIMKLGLLTWVIVLTLAGPAVAQELRPTLEKIRETGAIQLGYQEHSRPFSV